MEPQLTERAREHVTELRSRVKELLSDYYDTDFNLLRWLQGYSFDIETVVPKLRYHLKFRRSKWQLDGIVTNRKRDREIHKHWPSGLTGESSVANSNAIVWIEQSALNDPQGMLKTYSTTEIMHSRIYDYETMLAEVMNVEAKTGKQSGVIFVMDLHGLKYDANLVNLVTGPFRLITAFLAEHYVELFRHFVIVNAPAFIYQIARVVRPLLPERTKTKGVILSSEWKSEILEYASRAELPTFWNDGSEDKNDRFLAEVQRPVPYPESGYYNGIDDFAESFVELSVAAGKFAQHSVHVDLGDSVDRKLKFKFTCSGEFGFGVFYSETEVGNDDHDRSLVESLEMVYPQFTRMAGPTLVPVEDVVICTKTGHYYLIWGNHYAWWRALLVRYFVEMV